MSRLFSSRDFAELSLAHQQVIDSACNQFESEWRAGRTPRIRDFLRPTGNGKSAEVLFQELLRLELDFRRSARDEPSLAEYLSEFAEHATIVRAEFLDGAATSISCTSNSSQLDGLTPRGTNAGQSTVSALAARYQVGPEIASGGMGIVHRALDLQFRRDVALKFVKPSWLREADLVRRRLQQEQSIESFRYEADITARLQHPGIPPVHEVGLLPDGLPFLAMKLIQGETLEDLLRIRTSPQHELPRWLLVFEQIAQAVGYAHSRGILHRDLKPQNVMVGEFGEVQVMDWGLAKVLSSPASSQLDSVTSPLAREFHSQSGDVKGTLAYMAPEQARGEIANLDPRADVFGLGAILCQILTGLPPYEQRNQRDLLAAAATSDLATAAARMRSCGAHEEIVQLALRCLSATVEDRPASGTEVAQAVATYRANVELRLREAESERVRGEQRRIEHGKRRWLEYAIVLTLLVLVGYYAWANRIIADREGKAKQAAAIAADREQAAKNSATLAALREQEAKQSAALAAEREKIAKDESAISEAVNHFLNEGLLASADPGVQMSSSFRASPDLTVRELVLRAAEMIDGQFSEQPLVEARIRNTLAKSLIQTGEFEEAVRQQQASTELMTSLFGPDDPQVLNSQCDLARAWSVAGQFARSIEMLERIRDLRTKSLGSTHPDTVKTQLRLAIAYGTGGKPRLAQSILVAIREHQLLELGPDDPETISTSLSLAMTCLVLGELKQGVDLAQDVCERRRADLGLEHPDTLEAIGCLVTALGTAEQFDLAVETQLELIKLHTQQIGPNHPTTLRARGNLGVIYYEMRLYDKVIPLLEDVLQLQRQKLPPGHPDLLTVTLILATALHKTKQFARAIPLHEETVQQARKKLGDPHRQSLECMNNLASCYRDAGQFDKSRDLYQEAIGIVEENKQNLNPLTMLKLQLGLARTEYKLEQFQAAVDRMIKICESAKQLPSPIKESFRESALRELISMLDEMKRPEEAARWREEHQKLISDQ